MRRALSLLLAAFIVASVLVPSLGAAVAASSPPPGPSGMVGVPDSNMEDLRPAGVETSVDARDLSGSVAVSEHAATTEVALVTTDQADAVARGATPSKAALDAVCSSPAAGKNPTFDCDAGGSFALAISDGEHHAGREVAVETSVLRDALGHVPETLTIRNNETGETWTSHATVEDGWLVADVAHFSSNAVTWSGEVSLSGSPATNGTQYAYNLSDLDAASDPAVTLTGYTATEWDNESASGLVDGDSLPLDVGGNLAPTGPASGSPEIAVTNPSGEVATAYQAGGTHTYWVGDPWDSLLSSDYRIDNPPSSLSAVTVNVAQTGGSATFDVYVNDGGTPDNTHGEGTLVASGVSAPSSTGNFTIQFDQSVSLSNDTATLEFVTTSASGSSAFHLEADDSASETYFTYDTDDGSTGTESAAGQIYYGTSGPVNATVSTGSDSVELSSVPDGGTRTRLLDVALSDSAVDVALNTSGSVNAELRMQERTQTEDITLGLNGNTTTHSGTLADGETANLTLDSASLAEGENLVNVSVGDGTLTSDAPAPKVGLDYSHDASSNQTVDYVAERWSERYNVSKTFASDRESASLMVPFAGEVIGIRDVDKRVDGADWQTVATSSYSLEETTMTVELGSVTENTTVDVRAVGSKVDPAGMGIEVLEASKPGERLDSEISVTSVTGNEPRIGLPGSQVTYAYNESWPASDTTVFASDGTQTLHVHGAETGAMFRVSTIPVEVAAESGDVRLEVTDPRQSEPEFRVSKGPNGLDTDVAYTLLGAESGADYVLYSDTNGIVRDSGTANSPITLSDDDSGELLVFLQDSDSSSSSDSLDSDSGVIGGPVERVSGWNSLPAIMLAFAAVEIALFVVDRRIGSPGTAGVTVPYVGWNVSLPGGGLLFWVGTVTVGVLSLEFASGGAVWAAVAAGVRRALNAQGDFLLIVGALIVAYIVYKRVTGGSGPNFTIEARRGGK